MGSIMSSAKMRLITWSAKKAFFWFMPWCANVNFVGYSFQWKLILVMFSSHELCAIVLNDRVNLKWKDMTYNGNTCKIVQK